MNLYPRHRLAGLPAVAHRLELRIVLLHLRVAVHADLRVGHVRVRRHFDEAVAITAIHPELRDVHDRAETAPAGSACNRRACISASRNTRSRRSSRSHDHDPADRDLERQPICPAREKIRHTLRKCARVQATVASSKDGANENQTRNFSDGARVKGCCSSGGESQDCINACAERKTKFVKYSYRGENGEKGRLFR